MTTGIILAGGINDVKGGWKHKGYGVWFCILKRTHQQFFDLDYPQYAGVTLHPDWYTLSNFLEWYDNNNPNGDLAIDKDLHLANQYGPDTCTCITTNLNNALKTGTTTNGLPQGVRKHELKKGIRYSARIRKYWEATTSPRFECVEEAAKWYVDEKSEYLRKLATQESNPDIPELVENYIKEYLT